MTRVLSAIVAAASHRNARSMFCAGLVLISGTAMWVFLFVMLLVQ